MGQKYIAEKTLEEYNDVFSDIFNVLLFDGNQVIKECQLKDAAVYSMHKDDSYSHQQERDVAKYWNNNLLQASLFGIENQSCVDSDMPLRIMSYDGAAYRNQLNTNCDSRRYPVVTIVLYFGKGVWNKPITLFDVLDIPDVLKPFVRNYEITVFSISQLTEKQVKMFKSDFRMAAEFFVNINKNPDYRGSREIITHVDEFFNLMAVFSGDSRFEQKYNNDDNLEGGRVNTMRDFLDRVEERGRKAGIEQVVLKMIENNYTDEQIISCTDISAEELNKLREKAFFGK